MAYYRTGTNDFSAIQYENLEAGNIKNGVTVTVKDPNDQVLKSVTGTYTKSFVDNTYVVRHVGETDVKHSLQKVVSATKNISSMRFQLYSSSGYWGSGAYITLNGVTIKSGTFTDYTVTGITDNSTIVVSSGISRMDNADTVYIKIVSYT